VRTARRQPGDQPPAVLCAARGNRQRRLALTPALRGSIDCDEQPLGVTEGRSLDDLASRKQSSSTPDGTRYRAAPQPVAAGCTPAKRPRLLATAQGADVFPGCGSVRSLGPPVPFCGAGRK
jgi:hypothetical protein